MKKMLFRAAIVFAVTGAALSATQAQVGLLFFTPLHGGSGGDRFALSVPGENQVLRGMRIWYNKRIDGVQPFFGTLGQATSNTTPLRREGRPGGSGRDKGGKMIEIMCPRGYAIARFGTRAEGKVHGIQFFCRKPGTGQTLKYGMVGGTDAPHEVSECGEDGVAVGIYGRSGDEIDAFGLLCKP